MAGTIFEMCLFSQELFIISGNLICLSLGIFFMAALIGNNASNKPLSQLGKRQMGTSLFTNFLHNISSGIGVKGYDSTLGTFSPPLRILFHLSLCVLLYAAGLSLLAIFSSIGSLQNFKICLKRENVIFPDEVNLFHAFYFSFYFLHFLGVYVIFVYLFEKFSRGVSHLGGPRKSRIQRVPKWNDNITYIDQSKEIKTDTIRWHCDISTQSRVSTYKRFQIAYPQSKLANRKPDVTDVGNTSGPVMKGEILKLGLTGELNGRQTWSWTKSSVDEKETSKIDENLVQTMASGGRPKGFNPSVNPNR